MKLSPIIIEMLGEKAGCVATTPNGASIIAADIEKATGERLAANTIKRLTGILPYDNKPRETTLNIIARYLGYSSWEVLEEVVESGVSGFGQCNPFIEVGSLPNGKKIRFSWEPDRRVTLIHEDNGVCLVEKSVNSKLRVDDKIELSQIAEGYPLVAKDVVRDGVSLGNYVAAKTTGIHDISII